MNKAKIAKRIFIYSLVTLTILISIPNHAQSQVKEILNGQKVPDHDVSDIVNYKSTKVKLSEFKGKLVILDFWATWCAPCVSMFSKTDSLQKKFGDKLQFLPISSEPRQKVQSFLDRMAKLRNIKTSSIVNDTLFSQYFHYSAIPYYVWLNPEGRIIATTGADEITEKNISDVIENRPLAFENRKDIRRREIDYPKALFLLSNNFVLSDSLSKRDEVQRSDILSYSIAAKYIPNTLGSLYFDMDHFAIFNVSIEYLYRWYHDAGFYDKPIRGAFDSKRNHVFEIKDSILLYKILEGPNIKSGTKQLFEWAKNNAVSYEIVYPRGLAWKQKMELVRQDLERYFEKPLGFKAFVEKRIDSNVYVLRRFDKAIKLSTINIESEEHHDRYSYVQHNKPLSELLGLLNSYFFQKSDITFTNQTDFAAPVDLELNCDMANLASINEALKKYGLIFLKEPTQIDVLVFSDAKK